MRQNLSFRGLFFALCVCLLSTSTWADSSPHQLILRVDDVGMSHATNEALRDLAGQDFPFAASIMFNTPWYQEAVAILKANPHISPGVHLTLNAEWRHYRWGPIAGRQEVPSIINEAGHFYPSTKAFLKADYKLDDVETELRAQIERALATGLDIEYVDYHMRTALATPNLTKVVEELAEEYQLRLSMRMGEAVTTLFDVPIGEKKPFFMQALTELESDRVNVLIFHTARDYPEMQALVDLNNPAMNTGDLEPLVARHRAAELGVLMSTPVQMRLMQNDIELINYADLPNPFKESD